MLTARHLLDRKGSEVYSIGPENPVLEAIKLMAERHVGALLVMRGTELIGIVSERDYARKIILLGRSSAETPVRQIMSTPVITVTPGHTAGECMKLVTEQRVRHLPVLEQGRGGGGFDRRPGEGRYRRAAAADRAARTLHHQLTRAARTARRQRRVNAHQAGIRTGRGCDPFLNPLSRTTAVHHITRRRGPVMC